MSGFRTGRPDILLRKREVFALLPTIDGAQIGTGNPITGTRGEALTLTRATTRYCNPTVSLIGVNTPALEALGLSVEAAHTNLVIRSQEFGNAAWGLIGTTLAPTVTSDVTAAPDSTTTADALTSNQNVTAGGADQSIIRPVTALTVTSGSFYTFSVWLKKSGVVAADPKLFITDGIAAYGAGAVTCALTTSWQRFSVTMQVGATSVRPTIGWYDQAAPVTGQTIHMWGAQLEPGKYAHSYRPTVAASAATNADVATMAIPAALPVAKGELELDITPLWATVASANYILDTRNLTSSGLNLRVTAPSTLFFTSQASAGSFATVNSGALTWVAGQTYRIKAKWGNGNLYLYRDGVLVGSLTNGTNPMPGTHSLLNVGAAEGGGATFDGYIKNLRFFK